MPLGGTEVTPDVVDVLHSIDCTLRNILKVWQPQPEVTTVLQTVSWATVPKVISDSTPDLSAIPYVLQYVSKCKAPE